MAKKGHPRSPPSPQSVLIGEFSFPPDLFIDASSVYQQFESRSFRSLTHHQQFKEINRSLLKLIQKSSGFCLGAVLDYISKINQLKLLKSTYNFTAFEFWLNHSSDLSQEENYLIRAKIMGKFIPRDAYQAYFPIGNGSTYPGSHFVAAHLSPDMDTMIASFWGWVDAFAARVSTGQHMWCLPGGPPLSPQISLFQDLFGESFFDCLSRKALSLTLTAQDLVSQKNLIKEIGSTSINTIDHGDNEKAVILIDDQKHYLGDWRSSDVEIVGQVSILFKSCLHWFENNLHIKLISLFAAPQLHVDQVQGFINAICDIEIEQCEPVLEFTEKQKEYLDKFFTLVLNIPQGLKATFRDLSEAMNAFEVYELSLFIQELQNLPYSSMFDIQGNLIENRTLILNYIERTIIQLDIAIHCVRSHVERLDMAMLIKKKVLFSNPKLYVTLNSEVDEIRLKMKSFDYLPVLIQEENENTFPLGVIWADDLRKPVLGTVSLRDFSSHDEIRMAPYLSVISIIDHHRSAFSTHSTPLAMISDTQSSNVLVAEIACAINDRYSLNGMSLQEIETQLQELSSTPSSVQSIRLQRRLLNKASIAKQRLPYSIEPKREFLEYLTCLHGICDDTDLLTKVIPRDVFCVASLLNRMKSIIEKREMEIVHFDDIPRSPQFAKLAAKRILKCPDMYSIYRKMFIFKEQEVEKQIQLCGEGKPSDLFADTKEQNKYCRIGQIKLFNSNIPLFLSFKNQIIQQWMKNSMEIAESNQDIDLHFMMLSTISSADEVFEERTGNHTHQDELWIWGNKNKNGIAHLSSFLLAFQNAPELQDNPLTVEINPDKSLELMEIFQRHFLPARLISNQKQGDLYPWAIIKYRAGSVNSRKAAITPYLPHIAA